MPQCKSLFHETVSIKETDYWNDSCSVKELTYAIEHSAVNTSANPTSVMNVLKDEIHLWEDHILEIIRDIRVFMLPDLDIYAELTIPDNYSDHL